MDEEQQQLALYLYDKLSECTTTLSDFMCPLRDAYELSIDYTVDSGKTDSNIMRSWIELQRIERRLTRTINQLEHTLEVQGII